MVDPISDDERTAFARKVKGGFVALVALSAGMMSLQAEVGPTGFLAASGAGAVCGAVLVWLAFPSRETAQSDATESAGITGGTAASREATESDESDRSEW